MHWSLFIVGAGVLQGILLAIVIARRSHANQAANRWLAAFILCFALITLSDMFDRTVELHRTAALLHLFDWMVFLLAPFLLMYLREMTGERVDRRGAWFLHFAPATLGFLLYLTFMVLPPPEKVSITIADLQEQAAGNPGSLTMIIAVQMMCYLAWGWLVLARYARQLKQQYSMVKRRTLNWLRFYLGANMVMWMVWLVASYTSSEVARVLDDIGFPVLVYFMGYSGITQIDLTQVRAAIKEDSRSLQRSTPAQAGTGRTESPAQRYEHSGLTQEMSTQLCERLNTLMRHRRPYLESDLNLRELASMLDVPSHHLSQVLNERYGRNFFDFVNAYRAEAVKTILEDPSRHGESLLSIAFASGFASKATFNAFFKKHTGQTPRRYRAACVQSHHPPSP